jgi:hypothetical protein
MERGIAPPSIRRSRGIKPLPGRYPRAIVAGEESDFRPATPPLLVLVHWPPCGTMNLRSRPAHAPLPVRTDQGSPGSDPSTFDLPLMDIFPSG